MSATLAGMSLPEIRALTARAKDMRLIHVAAPMPKSKPIICDTRPFKAPERIVQLMRDYLNKHEAEFTWEDFNRFLTRSKIYISAGTVRLYLRIMSNDGVIEKLDCRRYQKAVKPPPASIEQKEAA